MTISDFSISRFALASKHALSVEVLRLTAGEVVAFPVLVVRGREEGKTFLVCAGVHGDEYEGMEAIRNVYVQLQPDTLRGTFVGVPVVNALAYTAFDRVNRFDRQDLARVFPGSPTGTLTEQIAYHFTESFIAQADFLCDLHSAGTKYRIHPHVGYAMTDEPLMTIQREAAFAFGLDWVWGSPLLPGRSLSAAREKNVPAIFAEMTGAAECRPEDVQIYERGILNVMRYLGMLDSDYPNTPPKYFLESADPHAAFLQQHHLIHHAGFLRSHVQLWEFVQQGQLIGTVIDPLGSVLQEIRAEKTGRIIFLRAVPVVLPGEPMCAVFECGE